MTTGGKEVSTRSLLVEIGTEELPPKALRTLGTEFASQISGWLCNKGYVGADNASFEWYATPRRLAIVVKAVNAVQPTQFEERRGPAVKAAFDGDGNPTRAAAGFATSCGVAVEDLDRISTDKGEWLAFRKEIEGGTLADSIESCIQHALAALPIPKRMRWGSGSAEFVRPLHWLVILHGASLLDANVFGIQSGHNSRGHRFHAPASLRISSADKYEAILLEKGFVWANFEQRKLEIHLQTEQVAKDLGGTAVIDESLLEEVTGLVELPQAIAGNFDEKLLEVPTEALVSSMRDHQKYFHIVDDSKQLMPNFITISNIKSSDVDRVRQGNERVLRARLADAEYFWLEDHKQKLESRVERLKGLLFHRKLGSVYAKTLRIMALSRGLARDNDINVDACVRAAQLCKADLVSAMVGEFPDLQGTMGKYYARGDGETAEVSLAIEEHYFPRQAGDSLPSGDVGRIVSIADKVDTLAGIFVSGEEPTGDKDPYALRRLSLGLIRTFIEGELDLDLNVIFEQAIKNLQNDGVVIPDGAGERAVAFITDRYAAYYAASGFSSDEVAAVGAIRPTRPYDVDKRLHAVAAFRSMPASASLAAANKRINNILKKVDSESIGQMDFDLLKEPAELELGQILMRYSSQVSPLIRRGDYASALEILSRLREPVDQFFDGVMVMDTDLALRANRIALLNQLSGLFMGIADISKLQPREAED
jgi:glycyl-tRNA synthetase beta chain